MQSLSQIGAIIDFSTDVAFFRHLTDQSVVQLERETTCHLHLSPVEDRLSKTISDKCQLQGSKQLRRFWEISTNQENTGCLAASSHTHIIRDSDIRQHNTPVTTNQLQTAITTPVSHARQLLGSMQHSTTNVPSLTVKTNESDSDVSVGSRRTQEGRMPTTVGCLGEVQPRRGMLVLELKAMIKDLLSLERRGTGKPTLGSRKDDQEPAGGQGTTATDSSIREPHERTFDQDYKGRPCAAVKHQGLGLPGFRQAQSQDISRSTEDGSRILSLDPSGGGSAAPWKLKRFSSWLKMQNVFQEPNLEHCMTQERMTRRIRQLEEEKAFAEMQASKELDKRRKTPEQKVVS